MTVEDFSKWLEGKDLSPDQQILAGLCMALAKSFDQNPHTSTAAELRKTFLELQRQIGSSVVEVDPLEKLLTR
jgi:hypothetical protein